MKWNIKMKKKHHCKRESENILYNKLNNIVVVCYFMQSGQCCCDRMLIRILFTYVMGGTKAR